MKFRLFSPAANRSLSGILINADHVPASGYTLTATSVVVVKAVLARHDGCVANPFKSVFHYVFVTIFEISAKWKISNSFYLTEKAQGSSISVNVRPREARHWSLTNLLPNSKEDLDILRARKADQEKSEVERSSYFFYYILLTLFDISFRSLPVLAIN